MNSPPFSSSNDPSNFSELLSDSEPPQREGLPAGFRMRASAHYVDQLDNPPRPTLRPVAISAIESESPIEAPDALVASVRQHGVLEPLLIQHDPRGRQFRLIAGRSRLAAARAAGLREVPCIVHAITDEAAAELIEQVRHSRSAESSPPPAAEPAASLYPAQREIESALTTIESCSPLLHLTSAPARRGAAQVIAVECKRAHRILKAMTVLTTGVAARRTQVKPIDLFGRVRDSFRDEQRLLGSEPTIAINADAQLALYGDDDLLVTAMVSALAALTAAAGDRPRDLVFTASLASGPGVVTLDLTDRSVIVSQAFIRSGFTSAWPVPDGDSALLLLQAARAIVQAHGGTMALAQDAAGTTARLQLPGS